MMQKRYLLIGLFFILLSCTEEVKVTPFTFPKAFTGETQRSWVMRSFQILREGKGAITLLPTDILIDCVADDIYTFYYDSQRTYRVTDGSAKCNSGDPDTIVESSWAFVNSTAALTIIMPIFSDQPLPFILREVDDTKMVLDIYFDDESSYRLNFRQTSHD